MRTLVTLVCALIVVVSLSPALAECPPSSVNVTSRNGAYDATLDWGTLDSVVELRNSLGRQSAFIYLANFDLAGVPAKGLDKRQLMAGQGVLILGLTRQIAGQKQVALVPGTYDLSTVQGAAEQTGSIRIRVPGGKTVSFDTHHSEGSFELLEVSGSRLCGRFSLKDKFSEVSGTFTAPFR